MKTFQSLIALALLATLFQSAAFAQSKEPKVKTAEIKTSAQCDDCKERIEEAMAFTKGVKSAELDVETAILTVTYKTKKTGLNEIRKAVSEVGYQADDLPANSEAYKNLPECCQLGGHKLHHGHQGHKKKEHKGK